MNDTEKIQMWIEWAAHKKGMSPSSVHSYARTFQSLLDWMQDSNQTISTVTVQDLESFIGRPRTGRAINKVARPATLKRETAELKSLFRWMRDRGLVGRDVTVELVAPPVFNEAPKPVTDETWKRLWSADLTDEERVAYGLAFFTGLRREEICRLTEPQFLSHPREIISDVIRKGGKRQNISWASCIALYASKRPDLVIHPEVFTDALGRLLAANAGRLVLARWDGNSDGFFQPDRYSKWLERRCGRLGILPVTPHQFRHSFATNLIRMEVPIPVVARMCGHSSVEMTMRYVDTGEDPLGEILGGQPLKYSDRWGRR